MNYVFDSSSLIYLGKLGLLEKIKNFEGKKFIPKNVYQEVIIKGLERKEPETKYIEEMIKNKIFIIKESKKFKFETELLSEADKGVISLAKETDSTAIIDEIYARNIVKLQGIKVHGLIYFILKLLENNTISKNEALNYLDRLIILGFYLSPLKYKEIFEIIKKM